MGYTYEKDQLIKLRRQIDKMLSKMEAFDKGLLSDNQIELFKLQLPVYLKAIDKLHPNKQDPETPPLLVMPFQMIIERPNDTITVGEESKILPPAV